MISSKPKSKPNVYLILVISVLKLEPHYVCVLYNTAEKMNTVWHSEHIRWLSIFYWFISVKIGIGTSTI